jgi:hypothetical protein
MPKASVFGLESERYLLEATASRARAAFEAKLRSPA